MSQQPSTEPRWCKKCGGNEVYHRKDGCISHGVSGMRNGKPSCSCTIKDFEPVQRIPAAASAQTEPAPRGGTCLCEVSGGNGYYTWNNSRCPIHQGTQGFGIPIPLWGIGREDSGSPEERQQPSKLHNEGSNPSSPSNSGNCDKCGKPKFGPWSTIASGASGQIQNFYCSCGEVYSASGPAVTQTAEQFLAQRGLADLSLYWPTGKPLPKIDYESKEAAPTLIQLMSAFAAHELAAQAQELDLFKRKLTSAQGDIASFSKMVDKLTKELAAARTAQRWIPVSEKLPEIGLEVLAGAFITCKFVDGRTTSNWQQTLMVFDGKLWLDSDSGEEDAASHWMPLPKPPVAGTEREPGESK